MLDYLDAASLSDISIHLAVQEYYTEPVLWVLISPVIVLHKLLDSRRMSYAHFLSLIHRPLAITRATFLQKLFVLR